MSFLVGMLAGMATEANGGYPDLVSWLRAWVPTDDELTAAGAPRETFPGEDDSPPDLIDLDTGDEYEWVTEPAGGGPAGYAHINDHDFAWTRGAVKEQARVAEVDSLPPEQLAGLRRRYRDSDSDDE